MFIYHFHRIIRNKIFWGAFAILISFTFVAVDSCSTPAPQSRIAGKLAGKAVTYERFEEAAKLVVSTQNASTSYLQTRMGMGFAKSARVMNQLEAAGIVSPQDGSKKRQVLVGSLEELDTILNSL